MTTADEAMIKKLDGQLAAMVGGATLHLISGTVKVADVRKEMSEWWNGLTEEFQDLYREPLRVQLTNIKRGAEAMTQELFTVSVKR